MKNERLPHDASYKQIFSNPDMVASLLRDFVSEDFISELDFSTLEQCSGSYVTDDLRERHDPDGHSSLMLVCARLRYVAVQKWGAERYMGMKKLEENK